VSVTVSITLCWPFRVGCSVFNKPEFKYVHKSNPDRTQEKTTVTRKRKVQQNISAVYFHCNTALIGYKQVKVKLHPVKLLLGSMS